MANVYNKSIVVLGGAETPIDNGMIYEGKYRVRYFDIDGTILKIEYVAEGGTLNPPTNPNYDPDYLIFNEWNYDIENYIVEQPTDIGAIYDTVDDATYMFCRFTTKTGLNANLVIRGYTSIDWGDGFIDSKSTHTYANEGEYIIKIYGNISFDATASNNLLGSNSLSKALKKCYIKNGVTKIGEYTFSTCNSLISVSIPNSVTEIGQYTFSTCCSLRSVSIPNSVTEIGQYAFFTCYSLISVSIPNSVTSIGTNTFEYCHSLRSVSIPNSVTSISNSTFKNCYGLTSVSIPNSVTSIGNSTFKNCYGLTNYFIYCDTIPTLESSNAFSGINNSTIFWIIDSIIDGIKIALNWEFYANQMKSLSWYPSLTDPNA